MFWKRKKSKERFEEPVTQIVKKEEEQFFVIPPAPKKWNVKDKTSEFIQVYLESLGTLDAIAKDSSAMRVLIYLWNKTPFIKDNDDCAFIVSSTWKALCSDDLGISPRTIGTAIKALEEHKFILPGKRKNVYSLNPKYFFKGNLETRAQIVSTVNISIEPSEDFQA